MGTSTFRKTKIKDLLEEKISVEIKRGREYSFIPMENVESGAKFPRAIETKTFNGSGSKFSDGDTLFARITPCLQNKKIIRVKELQNGVGFGSTEFFVFRAKNGRTDPDYLYYTTKLEDLISTAKLSMAGASGRQRADINSIYDYEVCVPDFPIQTRIASVLSAYDDLIENNEKRTKALEGMAQLLYAEWFVKFKFPRHQTVKMVDSDTRYGMIPEGWEVVKIDDILETVKRKTKLQTDEYQKTGLYPIIDQGKDFIAGYTENGDTVYKESIIVFGDHSRCFKYINFPFACGADGTQLLKTNDSERMPQVLLFYSVVNAGLQNFNYARHFKFLKSLTIMKPDKTTARAFHELTDQIFNQIKVLRQTNIIVGRLRELLIPQLVTGKREVKGYDQKNQKD